MLLEGATNTIPDLAGLDGAGLAIPPYPPRHIDHNAVATQWSRTILPA
jgi:hypothetical protein